MTLSPASQALAYRIWGYCNPLGWGQTSADVAQALDETPQRISAIVRRKNWQERFIMTVSHNIDFPAHLADDAGHAIITSQSPRLGYALISETDQ